MEYGFWLSKRDTFRTLRECRHHGLQEFSLYKGYGGSNWACLKCHSLCTKGIHTSKIAGCSNTTGIIIAEAVLSKAFKVMVKAHSKDAFDFYCEKNLKIDSKCSTLVTDNGKRGQDWKFYIMENKVPDAFCLIALDNLPGVKPEDANPVHVWLIRGDDIIDGRPLNSRKSLGVSPRTLARLEPWRRTDMEGRIIKCCTQMKEEVENGKS